jgi:hypothetical protein
MATSGLKKDGSLVVVFDESLDSDGQHGGGRVAALVISLKAKKGYQSKTLDQHQSLCRLLLQGLGPTRCRAQRRRPHQWANSSDLRIFESHRSPASSQWNVDLAQRTAHPASDSFAIRKSARAKPPRYSQNQFKGATSYGHPQWSSSGRALDISAVVRHTWLGGRKRPPASHRLATGPSTKHR